MGNLVFQATLGGQVNLVGPNTASTFNINVPTVNGNMVTTGDTGTVTNTMCATSVYTAPGTIGSGTPNTGAFTTLTTTSTINNLTVGRGAGAVSTNTAVGASALAANTTGAQGVAIGYQALQANTTASNNTAIGYQAAYSFSSTGTSPITAVGALAAYSINAADPRITAVGYQALYTNNGGGTYENTAVGWYAARLTTTGSGLVAMGNESLAANTTGSSNVGIGYQALTSNTTASNNTAVGYRAGYSNTTGAENSFLGYLAGNANTTGSQNTFIGRSSGVTNQTGTEIVAVGFSAMGACGTAANYNTAIGRAALNNVTGTLNVGLGNGSGSAITSGSKNTIIGSYSGNQGGLDIRTASNYIVLSDGDGNPRGVFDNNGYFQVVATGLNLGGGTTPSIWRNYGTVGAGMHLSDNSILPTSKTGSISDNTVTWGSASYRWSVIYAANGTINTSDRSEKQDIQDLSAAELAVAQEIKGLFKTFRWKDAVAKKGDAARINVGVIAQDVQAAFANHGLDASRYALWCSDTWYEVDGIGVNNETGLPYTADDVGAIQRTRLGVRYDQLLAFVIAAM